MGVIIYSFNLNISPKISYGVPESDTVVTELHAYDLVIKKGRYLCWTLYLITSNIFQYIHETQGAFSAYQSFETHETVTPKSAVSPWNKRSGKRARQRPVGSAHSHRLFLPETSGPTAPYTAEESRRTPTLPGVARCYLRSVSLPPSPRVLEGGF